MRILLALSVAVALMAASAASGTSTAARIWLVSPTVVGGSGFPAGKVTVTAHLQTGKAIKVVRALQSGRFTARFAGSLRANGCQRVAVQAVGLGGIQATMHVPGNAKDCAPPVDP